jgi:hypothetical protein
VAKKKKSKANWPAIVFCMVLLPPILRLFFLAIIKDVPFAWVILSVMCMSYMIIFGKTVRNNSHEVKLWGNDKHISTRYFFPLFIYLGAHGLTEHLRETATHLAQEVQKTVVVEVVTNRASSYTYATKNKSLVEERLKTIDVAAKCLSMPTTLVRLTAYTVMNPIYEVAGGTLFLKKYKGCFNERTGDYLAGKVSGHTYGEYSREFLKKWNAQGQKTSSHDIDKNFWPFVIAAAEDSIAECVIDVTKQILFVSEIKGCDTEVRDTEPVHS